jgi:hypothetical protein
MLRQLLIGASVAALTVPTHAAPSSRRVAVESGTGLELVHVVSKTVTYNGRKAIRLVEASRGFDGNAVALLDGLDFKDGTIDVDVAGRPAEGSVEAARGFVGVAFRSSPHASAFDCFYIRPTNGRADDQVRRNHATQYVSEPDFDFARLRTDAPGVYESYVDLATGAWTHLRIEVSGVRARLFVNGAAQPALIVNDLKRGVTSGQVGLWIGFETEAFFRDLQVTTN